MQNGEVLTHLELFSTSLRKRLMTALSGVLSARDDDARSDASRSSRAPGMSSTEHCVSSSVNLYGTNAVSPHDNCTRKHAGRIGGTKEKLDGPIFAQLQNKSERQKITNFIREGCKASLLEQLFGKICQSDPREHLAFDKICHSGFQTFPVYLSLRTHAEMTSNWLSALFPWRAIEPLLVTLTEPKPKDNPQQNLLSSQCLAKSKLLDENLKYLDVVREIGVRVVQQDDGFGHGHGLAHSHMVEEWPLLLLHRHVHNRDICVVKLVQDVCLAEIQALERDMHRLSRHAGTQRKHLSQGHLTIRLWLLPWTLIFPDATYFRALHSMMHQILGDKGPNHHNLDTSEPLCFQWLKIHSPVLTSPSFFPLLWQNVLYKTVSW